MPGPIQISEEDQVDIMDALARMAADGYLASAIFLSTKIFHVDKEVAKTNILELVDMLNTQAD